MNINYGFTDYNGNTWSKSSVDTYNKFNEEVDKRGNPAHGTMAHKELEFYKDQRHKCFAQLMEIQNKTA